jgi:hypothetical protein
MPSSDWEGLLGEVVSNHAHEIGSMHKAETDARLLRRLVKTEGY